jgi:amphi-Trp domain-containing protein
MSEETLYEEQAPRKRRRIATFLRRLASRFDRGETVTLGDAQGVAVTVPPEPDFEVEVEREDETIALELEIEWDEADGDINTASTTSQATFEVYEDSAGEYRWRLVHRNGNIIADSGEGYTAKTAAMQGLESVRSNAPGAYVVDQSKEDNASQEGGSKATFELFEDTAGEWRWRLRHDNGNIIADSGQGYSSKQSAKQGLGSVRTNVPGAPVDESE